MLTGRWVSPHTRDSVVEFIRRGADLTGIAGQRRIGSLGITSSKYFDWQRRYGRANNHNGSAPRDFWVAD